MGLSMHSLKQAVIEQRLNRKGGDVEGHAERQQKVVRRMIAVTIRR